MVLASVMLDGRELALRHPAELLGRLEVGEPPEVASAFLVGKRVLVTGAGGSVGPPLAEAIAAAAPALLVLVDHHEASLWNLHRRFGEHSQVQLQLADIRNRARLAEVLNRFRPEVVFHLAAYKHVPFGEVFPDEVYGVNVQGTRVLVELSAERGVERFIYPSSDKSCNPPSLYGATKRLSEVLVRAVAERTGLCYNTVRFVNILGTQGSVIETFARQVREGRALTVTDAAMTRYWVSMNEAVWLLLRAARLSGGQEMLMLDARDEVSVVEMARRVSRLLRGEEACDIAFGRPRLGERIREELLSSSERFEAGPAAGLLRVVDTQADEHVERILPLLHDLDHLAMKGSADQLRAATMAAARVLQ